MKDSREIYTGRGKPSGEHDRQVCADERRASVENSREEMLPLIVEDRLQEAYEQIRRGEVKQMKKQFHSQAGPEHSSKSDGRRGGKGGKMKSLASAAAVLALILIIPSAVYAAVVYFQRTTQVEEDVLTYTFALNYELVPGEYQVKADYIPKGFEDDTDGDGKYYGENEEWITIMPIYTTAELDRINNEITLSGIEKVEHTKLSGMEADVITPQDAKRNRSNRHIFLFNEEEGYVLQIVAGYGMEEKELLKFSDSLQVLRIGDGSYEAEEEKLKRQQEEADTAAAILEGEKRWDALMALGIPEEKIRAAGEELRVEGLDQSLGFTVTGYELLDSMEGFDRENFFDDTRFDGWLNGDMTLRPYRRQHLDKNGELLGEDQAEQKILQVHVKAHCYDNTEPDVSLNFMLQYVTKTPEGVLTWAEDSYEAVPEEDYWLQMDNSAVYFDRAVNTEGENRSHFFYREMKAGEDLEYTLLFVVDSDRTEDFLLYPAGINNDLWQAETMSAGEIRDSLEGYISLQK